MVAAPPALACSDMLCTPAAALVREVSMGLSILLDMAREEGEGGGACPPPAAAAAAAAAFCRAAAPPFTPSYAGSRDGMERRRDMVPPCERDAVLCAADELPAAAAAAAAIRLARTGLVLTGGPPLEDRDEPPNRAAPSAVGDCARYLDLALACWSLNDEPSP